MTTWMWVVAGVVVGRMAQLYLTYLQSRAFNAEVRRLRVQGTVSVGLGGKRYRGGRAFVALAIDPVTSRVVDAITLQGWTTFAKARPLPALAGVRLNKLLGDRELPGVSKPQRLAARQAAELYRDAAQRRQTPDSPGAEAKVATGSEVTVPSR